MILNFTANVGTAVPMDEDRINAKKKRSFFTWRNLPCPAGPMQDAVRLASSLAVERSSSRAGTAPCMVVRVSGNTRARNKLHASCCVLCLTGSQRKIPRKIAPDMSDNLRLFFVYVLRYNVFIFKDTMVY